MEKNTESLMVCLLLLAMLACALAEGRSKCWRGVKGAVTENGICFHTKLSDNPCSLAGAARFEVTTKTTDGEKTESYTIGEYDMLAAKQCADFPGATDLFDALSVVWIVEEERSAVHLTPNGLVKKPVAPGDGVHIAKKGDTISAHYTGTLMDGKKFDSSVDRGQPFVFKLGVGQVIKGWDEGFLGMSVGEKAVLYIPFPMAYGAQGSPPLIPPRSALRFEVELIAIK